MLGMISVLALVLCSTNTCRADEITRVFLHGKPIADHSEAWEGRIQHASWIDDELIVFFARGEVSCVSTKTGQVLWTVGKFGKTFGFIFDWSVSRSAKRLAICDDDFQITVIDGMTGTILFQPTSERLEKLLGLPFVYSGTVALMPTDGRLIFVDSSSTFGRHGYVLDASYTKLEMTFEIDGDLNSVSISPDGKRISAIASNDLLSIREMHENRDIFLHGARQFEEPKSQRFAVDAPFYSNLRDSGKDFVVYTRDCPWTTGEITVLNLLTEETLTFSGRNGHIEMDVSFRTNRLAITGTSQALAIVDFKGKEISVRKSATMNRNSSVEFSPSDDRILVGSWDNTISVYSIGK